MGGRFFLVCETLISYNNNCKIHLGLNLSPCSSFSKTIVNVNKASRSLDFLFQFCITILSTKKNKGDKNG